METLHKLDPSIIDESQEQHEYRNGTWAQEPRYKYQVRVDVCVKCGCERHNVKNKHIPEGQVTMYWRGKMGFDKNNEPSCWGGPNP